MPPLLRSGAIPPRVLSTPTVTGCALVHGVLPVQERWRPPSADPKECAAKGKETGAGRIGVLYSAGA